MRRKKNPIIKKDEQEPITVSSSDSSIAPSTKIPASTPPPIPEVAASVNPTKQSASATDTMILKMGEENSLGVSEEVEKKEKTNETNAPGIIDNINIFLSEISEKSRESKTSEKEEEQEEKKDLGEENPNTLFPGLKTIKNAFSSPQKDKKNKES